MIFVFYLLLFLAFGVAYHHLPCKQTGARTKQQGGQKQQLKSEPITPTGTLFEEIDQTQHQESESVEYDEYIDLDDE